MITKQELIDFLENLYNSRTSVQDVIDFLTKSRNELTDSSNEEAFDIVIESLKTPGLAEQFRPFVLQYLELLKIKHSVSKLTITDKHKKYDETQRFFYF